MGKGHHRDSRGTVNHRDTETQSIDVKNHQEKGKKKYYVRTHERDSNKVIRCWVPSIAFVKSLFDFPTPEHKDLVKKIPFSWCLRDFVVNIFSLCLCASVVHLFFHRMAQHFVVFVFLIISTTLASGADRPRVVASILPVHSLVAGVMEGAGTPALIVKGIGSAHLHTLRPSGARALERADLVFWVGPTLETFLEKPLKSLSGKASVVALVETPGLELLRSRKGGLWTRAGKADHAGERNVDPHIWLDPANAKKMVAAIRSALVRKDPLGGDIYRANARRLVHRLDALARDLEGLIAPVREVPYLVYHDGFQYFERRFGLNALGSVTASPERKPGPRRVRKIRELIEGGRVACVFGGPRIPFIAILTEGSGTRSATLDPLGTGLTPGPDQYFAMMRANGASLVRCLSGG